MKKPRNIVAGLKAFAERVNAAGVDGLRATFTKLQQRGPHPPKMSVAVQTRNKAKCRYFGMIFEKTLHSFMRYPTLFVMHSMLPSRNRIISTISTFFLHNLQIFQRVSWFLSIFASETLGRRKVNEKNVIQIFTSIVTTRAPFRPSVPCRRRTLQ